MGRRQGPPAGTVALVERVESPWLGRAAWGIIILGWALRLRSYAAGRSLRRDEADLARNLVERSFRGLLEPLDYAQGAPIGFLMLEKGVITALGHNELAFRLVPLLAGLASLPLFFGVARRLVGPRAVLVGLALVAFTEPMVYYASELKQYSCDVLVGLVILAAASAASARGHAASVIGRPFWLALVGAVAVWFSHPALFILGGVGLALFLPDAEPRAFWRRRALLLGVVACWAVSFLVDYVYFLRPLRQSEDLQNFWSKWFMPMPPRSVADLRWYGTTLLDVFNNPVGLALEGVGVALALVLLGGFSLAQRSIRVLAVLATPILLALAASALHAYPFSGRLLLFTVPLLAMWIVAGAEFVWGHQGGERQTMAVVLLTLVLFGPTLNVPRFLVRPIKGEELKAVLRVVDRDRQPEDTFYLYFASKPAFLYYSRYADQPVLSRIQPIEGADTLGHPERLAADIGRLAGRSRVWFIISHAIQGDEGTLVRYLDVSGRCLARVKEFGASAYLYDLTRAPVK